MLLWPNVCAVWTSGPRSLKKNKPIDTHTPQSQSRGGMSARSTSQRLTFVTFCGHIDDDKLAVSLPPFRTRAESPPERRDQATYISVVLWELLQTLCRRLSAAGLVATGDPSPAAASHVEICDTITDRQ